MKVLFYPVYCVPFHKNILNERPLGGTETAVIHLANALADLGHQVFVVASSKNTSEGNPAYITDGQTRLLGEVDVYIVLRDWRFCFNLPFKCNKVFYWTSDAPETLYNVGIGDPRFYDSIQSVFCVSYWQAKALCNQSNMPLAKTWILRNGVRLQDFSGSEERHRRRLIYTSHPDRGLIYLLEIFKQLKSKYSDLELHVFSSFTTHAREVNTIPQESQIIQSFHDMPGCYFHGNILQRDLAREYMKSAVWTYPTAFQETSCISAMEAQAAGCVILTSALAALNETVGDVGILLHETPGTSQYMTKYIQVLDRILSDDELFEALSNQSLEHAVHYDWKLRALSLLDYLGHQRTR